MQVDLELDATPVTGLPRFQQAAVQSRKLRRLAYGLGAVAGSGWVLAFFVCLFAPQSLWLPLLVNQGAALLVLVASLQSAWWVARWRARVMHPPASQPSVVEEGAAAEGWYERLLERLSQRGRHLLGQIGAPTLWLGGWALLVLLGIEQVWNLTLPAAALGLSASITDPGGGHHTLDRCAVSVVCQRKRSLAGTRGGAQRSPANVGCRRTAVARVTVCLQPAA